MARWLLALAALLAGARPARSQPPRCPGYTPQRCSLDGYGKEEYTYTVDGLKLEIGFTDSGYFTLQCPENLTLDNPALPRFESQLRVNIVQLQDCPAPRASYAAALGALNVRVPGRLRLLNAGRLAGAHLAGLAAVRALELTGAELAPGALLAAPPGLRRLALDSVRLPPGELRHLPRSLELLDLTRMATDLPPDVLQRLPNLTSVAVRDARSVSVALGGALRVLALEMPAARVPSALSPALHSLTVYGWDEPAPERWSACALRTLNVRDVTAVELPAGWLSDCAELRVLRVEDGPRLRSLNETSLHGARRLQQLYLTSCALSALPAGLLDDAVELILLDLSGNLLKELPGGLFVSTRSLQSLSLAKNRLGTGVYASLAALESLASLTLSNNDLKDSCGGASDTVRGMSPLENLKKLTHLRLRKTNASLICRDWRENMPLLQLLDLSHNNITSVTYADLKFHTRADVQLNLKGNHITKLQYTRDDYSWAVRGAERSRTVVALGSALACDCYTYWAARALLERPEHASQLSAACARGPELRDVPLELLACDARDLCAGTPGCACTWRPGDDRKVLRVQCEHTGLARVADALAPVLDAARHSGVSPDDYDWELQFAHNRIAELGAADWPKHLSILNLTDNSLSTLSAGAAGALLADARRSVQLARNPLDCSCGSYATLLKLQAHQAVLKDYDTYTCANGSLLRDVSLAHCPSAGAGAGPAERGPDVGAVAAGVVLLTLLAAGALAGLLWHPALRLRFKAALHARGWLPASRAAEPDDAARRFDVFLSFSHGDERFVRDELVARLESGPAPYRLCVHYRDWAPGGWIPAQIAASVRASRRTVAVVSEHFLRSAWARAEFQEAHALALRDARPRLVVVLLDEPAALPLDDKLRRYLATNTYVRWGDPYFWQKLRLALPRGRGPAPAEQPEPAAPHVAVEVPPQEVCQEPSAASSLNTPESSSCSSSSAGSAMELDRLVSGAASCGAQHAQAAAAHEALAAVCS